MRWPSVTDLGSLGLQVAMGIGLAACAGLRAFLPLFVVSCAGRMGWVPLGERWDWLASDAALVVFGVAVVVELAADKIPFLDNLLDVLQTALKPAAGIVLVVAVTPELPPLPRAILGIVAGASAAGGVHLAKAKLRLLSSGLTAGTANPAVSVVEDGAALSGSLLAIVLPLLLIALALAGLLAAWIFYRWLRTRRRPA